MARRKNQPDTVRAKYHLAERLRTVRTELYGERGGPELARRLGVPIRTWYNYESGVTVPSEIVLRFIELTSVEPVWLLHGRGPRFRTAPTEDGLIGPRTSVESLLRAALDRLEGGSGGDRYPQAFDRAADAPGPSSAAGPSQADGRLPGRRSIVAPAAPWDSEAEGDGLYLRMEGDAMAPIVADGAFVAYAAEEEDAGSLDGKLVVVWQQGRPTVRWFERSGRYALLRTENPDYEPTVILLDLEAPPADRKVRRILWVGTSH